MTVLMTILGILVVVIGIGASIALHEIGHLVPAKLFGVKAPQYMIGFGPTLWSRRFGETEYGLKAIPLGGYVKMIGMFPPKRAGEDEHHLRPSGTGRWAAMIDDAREQSMEEVRPGDEHRVFYRLKTWQKLVVMLGGPVMNLVIATVLIGGVMMGYGMAVDKGARVAAVQQCVRPAGADTTAPCTSADPLTPAAKAGLEPGDRLVSIGGQSISRLADVSGAIRPHAGQAIPVVVERGGARQSLTLTPITSTLPRLGADGQPLTGADGKPLTEQTGFAGMSSAPITAIERQPITAVPGTVGRAVTQTAGVLVQIPQKMVGIAKAAFGSGERDPNGPISVVGVGRIGGEVASGQVHGFESSGARVITLLMLIASLNVALFVFNLIPLMPLDGGHVAGALWEGLRRQVAKVAGRPDPGYVDVAKGLPIAYAMSVVLIVMGGLLIYADIVRPVKLG
ncbi:M50 family metallopeptidase [Arsenicicoccus sp. oral taxon 190]|uniref:M50 family metallopeptidase n=1 Tax=Arsenicicoccus sp. oral taxon 190 TaxID=1658671 RepID=UPI000679EA36|nr:site-2 protease family protein [Arsenicicoccus sp. oral taxon 190]AKT52220.1 zinc metalloprotease [Arsenicicoccus sp. oral taxon 190]